MTAIKKPLHISLAVEGAGNDVDGCPQNTALKPTCPAKIPAKFFIHSNLIKILVFQRYADVLLICVGFIEEFGYGCN